ncbi:MAG TPA: hypothetical protein VHG30_07890, partial [Microvirga sp.]|nr:hypothetical protein [Microvirga sp.]
RPERRAGAGGEARAHNRPPRDGRPEERRGPRPERRPDERRDGPQTRREDRREKQPDPDSPFAKLMALKAQLENAKGGKS